MLLSRDKSRRKNEQEAAESSCRLWPLTFLLGSSLGPIPAQKPPDRWDVGVRKVAMFLFCMFSVLTQDPFRWLGQRSQVMVRKKCWQEVGALKCFLEAQLEIQADTVVVTFQWPCQGKRPPRLVGFQDYESKNNSRCHQSVSLGPPDT